MGGGGADVRLGFVSGLGKVEPKVHNIDIDGAQNSKQRLPDKRIAVEMFSQEEYNSVNVISELDQLVDAFIPLRSIDDECQQEVAHSIC